MIGEKKKHFTRGRSQLDVVPLTPPHREDIPRTWAAPHGRPESITATDQAVNLHLEEDLISYFRHSSCTNWGGIFWVDSF